jgi:4-amino-4-deoxy-L-arabinose transferase-like glycosyltransferase
MLSKRSRFTFALGAVALIGLAVRIIYVLGWKNPVKPAGDPYYYHYAANLLVDGKGFLHPFALLEQHIKTPGADHPPGYVIALAASSLFGFRSFLDHQIWSCVISTMAVVAVGYTGRRIAGDRAGLIAAVLAAAYPSFWFNDGLVLSETLVLLLTTLAVLAAYRLWERPSGGRAAVLGVAIAANALTRAETLLILPLIAVPLLLLDRRLAFKKRISLLVIAGVACAAAIAPWSIYNQTRFQHTTLLSTGLGNVLIVANCDQTYHGAGIGFWWHFCLADRPTPPGDRSSQEIAYRKIAVRYVRGHADRLPAVVWARLGRTFGFFRPDQQLHYDEQVETRNIEAGRVALGMYYAFVTLSVAGALVLRRRGLPISPLVGLIATAAVSVVLTYGQTRFRAPAEPAFVLLSAVALDALLRRGRRDDDAGAMHAAGPPRAPSAPVLHAGDNAGHR